MQILTRRMQTIFFYFTRFLFCDVFSIWKEILKLIMLFVEQKKMIEHFYLKYSYDIHCDVYLFWK